MRLNINLAPLLFSARAVQCVELWLGVELTTATFIGTPLGREHTVKENLLLWLNQVTPTPKEVYFEEYIVKRKGYRSHAYCLRMKIDSTEQKTHVMILPYSKDIDPVNAPFPFVDSKHLKISMLSPLAIWARSRQPQHKPSSPLNGKY